MIVVIDGPNKSGKSLLIENVVDQLQSKNIEVKVRHWGPLKTDDREYTESLVEDSKDKGIVIWDRSWVCESVYGTMLNRNRRLVGNPWLGEFLHTRGVKSNGLCFIVMPALAGQNIDLLDNTDAKYSDNPYLERKLFMDYADRFSWHKLFNSFNKDSLDGMTNTIINAIQDYDKRKYSTKVLFVLEQDEEDKHIAGGWLPGSTVDAAKYAQEFHYGAILSDWIYVKDADNIDLKQYSIIVATTIKLRNALKKLSQIRQKIEYVPLTGLINDIESYDEHGQVLESFNKINDILMRDWNAAEHILYV